MQRISASQSAEIKELLTHIDSLTLRTLLSEEDKRTLRPDRLQNLIEGRGRISRSEVLRLEDIRTNRVAIQNLSRKQAGKRKYEKPRKIRQWLYHGKAKGVDYKDQSTETKDDQLQAIKALRFFGIDPSEGTYYVRKRKLA